MRILPRVAGWSLSLIDIPGETALVIWFCGCNLMCPFCHNWRIATNDPSICKPVPLTELAEVLGKYSLLADWIQVTGGEPLVQAKAVVKVFESAREMGYRLSLDSNLTLPDELQQLLESVSLDHIATDVKYPPELMTGLPEGKAWRAWEKFLESLEMLSYYHVPWVELRILIAPAAGTPEEALGEALKRLKYVKRVTIRVVRLERRNARDRDWVGWGKPEAVSVKHKLSIGMF